MTNDDPCHGKLLVPASRGMIGPDGLVFPVKPCPHCEPDGEQTITALLALDAETGYHHTLARTHDGQ